MVGERSRELEGMMLERIRVVLFCQRARIVGAKGGEMQTAEPVVSSWRGLVVFRIVDETLKYFLLAW